MLPLSRLFLLGAALLLGSGETLGQTADAGRLPAWRIPPLDGELSGEFQPLWSPGAPRLAWTLTLQTQPNGTRAGTLRISGPGTVIHGEIALNAAAQGSWRIVTAQVELQAWSAAAMAFLGEDFAGARLAGKLDVSGEGLLADGSPQGGARFRLSEGRIEEPGRKLVLQGIQTEVTLEDLAGRHTAPHQRLTWAGGTYDQFAIGRGEVEFSMAGDAVQVHRAAVALFGGEIVVAGFGFSTAKPAMTVRAQVRGLEVAHLLPLLPDVLSAARGRVDGSVTLGWSPSGLSIEGGQLALGAGQTAVLRLAPTPGLLSGSMPEAVMKYYPGLAKIETGETPLRAEHLEVTFTPGGDAQGRTATVRIVGGPVDPTLTAPVDLNVNVRGPLDQLIKFGTDSRIRFGGKP